MQNITLMETLVLSYFKGVDTKDFKKIKKTLDQNCRLTVETHGIELNGFVEIEKMFLNLWKNHLNVCHKDFKFVADPKNNKIATQFSVINTLLDGKKVEKSNCNFFTIQGEKFKEINIYMSGINTLFIDT